MPRGIHASREKDRPLTQPLGAWFRPSTELLDRARIDHRPSSRNLPLPNDRRYGSNLGAGAAERRSKSCSDRWRTSGHLGERDRRQKGLARPGQSPFPRSAWLLQALAEPFCLSMFSSTYITKDAARIGSCQSSSGFADEGHCLGSCTHLVPWLSASRPQGLKACGERLSVKLGLVTEKGHTSSDREWVVMGVVGGIYIYMYSGSRHTALFCITLLLLWS